MLQYNLTCLYSRVKISQSKTLTKNISNHFSSSLQPFPHVFFWLFYRPYCMCVVSLLGPKLPSMSTVFTELGTNHWGKDIIYSLLPLGAPPSTRTKKDPQNTRQGWSKGPDPFLLELSQHWNICQNPFLLLTSTSSPPAYNPLPHTWE